MTARYLLEPISAYTLLNTIRLPYGSVLSVMQQKNLPCR